MIPVLETPRLRLRPPRREDLEAIYLLGANPNVMRFISNGKTMSRMEARADLEKRIAASQHHFGYWITELKNTREVIGWTALKTLDNTREIEVGYRLLEEHWGKGYATEASRRLLQYGFQELKLPRIVAVALEENLASRRVMEKAGLQYQGKDIFYGFDCVIYALDRNHYFQNIPS